MTNERIKIEVTGWDAPMIMEWDGSQASAPILVDGEHTGRQTADARHRTGEAVRLAVGWACGMPVYDDAAAAKADGREPRVDCVCWEEDVSYQAVDSSAERAIAQSVEQNEIVTIGGDLDVRHELLAACDDHADNGDVEEFWGETAEGHEWRVHVRG